MIVLSLLLQFIEKADQQTISKITEAVEFRQDRLDEDAMNRRVAERRRTQGMAHA